MESRISVAAALCVMVSSLLAVPGALAQGDVAGIHPAYALVDLWPAGMGEEGIGDFDFLPDGRLAVAIWGGVQRKSGKVFLLSGVTGNGPGSVTAKLIADRLNEPLGVKVVGDEIHVMLKHELGKLTPGADGSYAYATVYKGFFHNPLNDHQFSIGLIRKDGLFYFLATSSYAIMEESPERGALIRIDPVKKSHSIFANGFREPNGLILGPGEEIFVTDNQGEFIVTNKLINAREGRFYGCHGPASPVAAGRKETPPTVYLPYGETSYSPSQPMLIAQGGFQGQMLLGDVHYGGINRIFLERVKAANGTAEYQGCLFRFSAPKAFSSGINRLKTGPDGSIYVGGIGWGPESHNWNYRGISRGFQRLKPTGKVPFEMAAIRSLKDGFEIEFTQAAGESAGMLANYPMQKWWHTPTKDYGGPRIGLGPVSVASVTLSPDRRKAKVTLAAPPAAPNIYYFRLGSITSATGESLWNNEAWYTLLNVGPAEAPVAAAPRSRRPVAGWLRRVGNGRYRVEAGGGPPQPWEMRNLAGALLAQGETDGGGFLEFPEDLGKRGPLFFSLGSGKSQVTRTILSAP